MGDKTLLMLENEYNPPPKKIKSPKLMGDKTLSMLEN